MVMAAVCVLFGKEAEKKMDPNTNKYTFDFWPVAIKLMSDINFLKNILEFDRDTIDEKKVSKLKKFLDDPKF